MSIRNLELAASKALEIMDLPDRPSQRQGLTDLSIIGVPEHCQNRAPTVTAYPQKFSKAANAVWVKMIQDPEYKAKCRVWGNLDLVWHNTIQEFLGRCEDSDVSPFTSVSDTSKNEYVSDFVRRARIALVRYADESGILAHVRVRKAYREYIRKDNGLVIKSWAELYPLKVDGFEKWIQTSPMPRMLKHVDNTYVKVVFPHVKMWVRYLNDARVVIGFDIEIVGQVTVPGAKIASRKAVDRYIDSHVFLPTIRSHRFRDVKTRLF